jgi:transcription elongation GreA/GreB family factor
MENLKAKQQLLRFCHDFVDHRIATASQAMTSAQQAANEEGKNSAGDKYETGRAMMQIERDQAAEQLSEAMKLKKLLDTIDIERVTGRVALGSLVVSKNMLIFLAIGIGKANVEGLEYLIVAPHSPLGKALINKGVKDEFVINGDVKSIVNIL